MKKLLLLCFVIVLSVSFVNAIVVSDVSQDVFFPGESNEIRVDIRNTLEDDVEELSFSMNLENVQFISIGGSEDSVDELKDGRLESFRFTLKASQDITPGDYNIPYTITYTNVDDERVTKSGSFGVEVSAITELDFSSEVRNNIVGEQGEVSLKIVNSGFGDIKFVNVEISPKGFTLLSSGEDYVGNVDSDDFETATFDVVFNEERARLIATVKYKDFDNNDQVETVDIPLTVYTKERAVELGIIERNNTFIYLAVVLILVGVWFVYRYLRKRKKKKKEA